MAAVALAAAEAAPAAAAAAADAALPALGAAAGDWRRWRPAALAWNWARAAPAMPAASSRSARFMHTSKPSNGIRLADKTLIVHTGSTASNILRRECWQRSPSNWPTAVKIEPCNTPSDRVVARADPGLATGGHVPRRGYKTNRCARPYDDYGPTAVARPADRPAQPDVALGSSAIWRPRGVLKRISSRPSTTYWRGMLACVGTQGGTLGARRCYRSSSCWPLCSIPVLHGKPEHANKSSLRGQTVLTCS